MIKWDSAITLLREKLTVNEEFEAVQLRKLEKSARLGVKDARTYPWRDVLEWSLPLLFAALSVRIMHYTAYLAFSRAVGKILDTSTYSEPTQDAMLADLSSHWHARGLTPEVTTEIVNYAYRLKATDQPLLGRAPASSARPAPAPGETPASPGA